MRTGSSNFPEGLYKGAAHVDSYIKARYKAYQESQQKLRESTEEEIGEGGGGQRKSGNQGAD